MKSYIKNNQNAWDEAYRSSSVEYKDIVTNLKNSSVHYIPFALMPYLDAKDIKNKTIGQYACNNGRELLSIGLTHGASHMIGFDISPTMIKDANQSAQALNASARFIETDIYTLPTEYHHTLDTLFVLIGVLFWFDDLNAFFKSCHQVLKPNGVIYVLDGHPFTNVFAFEGEAGYNSSHPTLPVHSYFKKTPFIDQTMTYITEEKTKTTFTSYVHTFEEIIEGFIPHFHLSTFKESNINALDTFPDLDQKGIPLVFFMKGTGRAIK